MVDPTEILGTIWRTIFLEESNLQIAKFQKDFCFDLPLPTFAENYWGGDRVATSKPYQHVVSQSQIEENYELFQETTTGIIKPIDQLLNEISTKLVFSGDNCYDSSNVLYSDNIFKSLNVYQSRSIHDSKKVIFCANSIGLENAAACDNTGYSQFVIRAMDSINCSRCFDIYQSGKCSNSFFLSNCYDVHESILCANVRSKRFCIGNAQYTESDYRELKTQLLQRLVFENFKPMYEINREAT